jgi:acyl carrier protein
MIGIRQPRSIATRRYITSLHIDGRCNLENILARIVNGLQEIFPEIGDISISPETELGEIPDWDSMASVNFQSFLEQEFQVSVPQDFLGEATQIRDVVGYIENPDSASVAI